jgi:hypothetical protein
MSTKKDEEPVRIEYFADDKAGRSGTGTGSITSESDAEKDGGHKKAPSTARDLVSEILAVEDDPTINPWTFRMWFIGIGISVFGG